MVGSFALMTALVGSPVTGWLYDKKRNLPLLAIILAAAMLLGISLNYFQALPAAIGSAAIVGFVGGGLFTILSNAARERSASGQGEHHRPEYATLSVNWIHAIAVTGTFWAPILFSTAAIQYGYQTAWPLIGTLSFGIMIISSLVILRFYKRGTFSSKIQSRD